MGGDGLSHGATMFGAKTIALLARIATPPDQVRCRAIDRLIGALIAAPPRAASSGASSTCSRSTLRVRPPTRCLTEGEQLQGSGRGRCTVFVADRGSGLMGSTTKSILVSHPPPVPSTSRAAASSARGSANRAQMPISRSAPPRPPPCRSVRATAAGLPAARINATGVIEGRGADLRL